MTWNWIHDLTKRNQLQNEVDEQVTVYILCHPALYCSYNGSTEYPILPLTLGNQSISVRCFHYPLGSFLLNFNNFFIKICHVSQIQSFSTVSVSGISYILRQYTKSQIDRLLPIWISDIGVCQVTVVKFDLVYETFDLLFLSNLFCRMGPDDTSLEGSKLPCGKQGGKAKKHLWGVA